MGWCCPFSRLCEIVFACLLYCKYMWLTNQLPILLNIVFGSVCTSSRQNSHIIRYMTIAMTSHGRHGVSNYWWFVCLFNRCLGKHQHPRFRPFVGGIHRWPMAFLHKKPITRKTFPCHEVITIYSIDPLIQICIYSKHIPLLIEPAMLADVIRGCASNFIPT